MFFPTVYLRGHEKLLTESGMVVLVVGLNTAANGGRSLFIYSFAVGHQSIEPNHLLLLQSYDFGQARIHGIMIRGQ